MNNSKSNNTSSAFPNKFDKLKNMARERLEKDKQEKKKEERKREADKKKSMEQSRQKAKTSQVQ